MSEKGLHFKNMFFYFQSDAGNLQKADLNQQNNVLIEGRSK